MYDKRVHFQLVELIGYLRRVFEYCSQNAGSLNWFQVANLYGPFQWSTMNYVYKRQSSYSLHCEHRFNWYIECMFIAKTKQIEII